MKRNAADGLFTKSSILTFGIVMTDSSKNHQIVLAAFGTSTKSIAIYDNLKELFEKRFRQKIPVGFTSHVGSQKLENVLEELSVEKGLEVVITPLFMIPGKVVLEDVKKLVEECELDFKSVRVARPLLPDDRIYQVLKEELSSGLEKSKHEETGILFVGHGTPDEESSQSYTSFAQDIKSFFPASLRVALGNVETSAPHCRDVLGELIMSDIKTLVVQPLMIVDGVHIHEDIKGALDGGHQENKIYQHLFNTYGESFKSRLREITFVYKPGLGAYRGIFELFADHTMKAIAGDDVL
ncbi:MAG: sirohydrochlorin cobaltochelatase [Deltaproteobacteria bacterium]|nr:sirohydrochlorin cobaltochelatase [Deltaproteobacteria bacterium]